MEVSDSGPGFEPERASWSEGPAWAIGMRERVESLGGRFKIESETGQGTRIRPSFPCQWRKTEISMSDELPISGQAAGGHRGRPCPLP